MDCAISREHWVHRRRTRTYSDSPVPRVGSEAPELNIDLSEEAIPHSRSSTVCICDRVRVCIRDKSGSVRVSVTPADVVTAPTAWFIVHSRDDSHVAVSSDQSARDRSGSGEIPPSQPIGMSRQTACQETPLLKMSGQQQPVQIDSNGDDNI